MNLCLLRGCAIPVASTESPRYITIGVPAFFDATFRKLAHFEVVRKAKRFKLCLYSIILFICFYSVFVVVYRFVFILQRYDIFLMVTSSYLCRLSNMHNILPTIWSSFLAESTDGGTRRPLWDSTNDSTCIPPTHGRPTGTI